MQTGKSPSVAASADFRWSPALDWPQFWYHIQLQLRQGGYGHDTILLYRQVLRRFRDYCKLPPARVTRETIRNYIYELSETHSSWSWIGTNITALRLAFDRIGGRRFTGRLVTPKRGTTLPEILSRGEVDRLLNAAATIRDQLLLGLMYGCGLKVGELCRLRWRDVDLPCKRLNTPPSRQVAARSLQIPPALMPVLEKGVEVCGQDDYIFPGRSDGHHLSKRAVELIVRRAASPAGLTRIIHEAKLPEARGGEGEAVLGTANPRQQSDFGDFASPPAKMDERNLRAERNDTPCAIIYS